MDIEEKIDIAAGSTLKNPHIAFSKDEVCAISSRLRAAEKENARLQSIIDEANAQEHAGLVTKTPNVQMWVRFNESVGHGEALADGTKLYVKPIIYTEKSMPMPLEPTKEILSEMYRAINPRQSPLGQMHHVYRAALVAHQGFDLYARPIPAQQSPAVAVPDYKEELFQLRQQAENWSTKLGFIASAINSRKISLSGKECEFPHLLIERLHTDSELLKQRSGSPRITEQDALPVGYRENWKRNVMLMWSCVRKHDSSIPSDVLDYMREQLLTKLNEANHAK